MYAVAMAGRAHALAMDSAFCTPACSLELTASSALKLLWLRLVSLLWLSFGLLSGDVAGDFTATSAMIEKPSLKTIVGEDERLEESKRE